MSFKVFRAIVTTIAGSQKLKSDLSVPTVVGVELAPFLRFAYSDDMHTTIGCQGFSGPFPSAFLDKEFKELACWQADANIAMRR